MTKEERERPGRSNQVDLVESYLDALVSHGHDRVRNMLVTDGFRFESPIANFNQVEDYLEYLAVSGGILRSIERRRVFADGDDVCHWLTVETQLSEHVFTRAVQWTRCRDGLICSIEMLYDPFRYRMLFDLTG
ncbi:MAG: hypothetical protein WBG92_11675 [Thiohalocapsa sp.]